MEKREEESKRMKKRASDYLYQSRRVSSRKSCRRSHGKKISWGLVHWELYVAVYTTHTPPPTISTVHPIVRTLCRKLRGSVSFGDRGPPPLSRRIRRVVYQGGVRSREVGGASIGRWEVCSCLSDSNQWWVPPGKISPRDDHDKRWASFARYLHKCHCPTLLISHYHKSVISHKFSNKRL